MMTDPGPEQASANIGEQLESPYTRIRYAGEKALHRLLPIAQGDGIQNQVVRSLLLGCYNGQDFPIDPASLRVLNRSVMEDCIALLLMDPAPAMEVHQYVENGSSVYNGMAERWQPPSRIQMQIPTSEDETSEVLRTLGKKSLQHLIAVAQGFSGQCRHIARFLVGCYDGCRYPFDPTRFRCIDHDLFLECIAVIRLLYETRHGIDKNILEGVSVFNRLIQDWSIEPYSADAEAVR
jgi:hypothetical protein